MGAAAGREVRWRQVLRRVAAALRGSGLDLVAALSVEWYNAAVPQSLHLPCLGRRDMAPLAILVGSSKAIWDPFICSLRAQPCLLNAPHPFNAYVKQSVTSALRPAFHVVDSSHTDENWVEGSKSKEITAVVYWDFETRPGKLVAMQRLALIAGMASFDESSNLCVHPCYGPWFALRAVVLFDVDPPMDRERPKPLLLRSRRPLPQEEADRRALEQPQIKGRDQGRQLGESGHKEQGQWREWLAIRDAIHPNHPMRYELDQIEYHYTHKKEILTRLSCPAQAAV